MRRLWILAITSLSLSVPATSARAQDMTLGGVGAAAGIASGMGAISATNITAGGVTKGIGQPNLPPMDDSRGGAATASSTTVTTSVTQVVGGSLGSQTGENVLSELLNARTARAIPETRRMTSRQRAAYSRRLRSMTPAQRTRLVQSKYQKPGVGWLAYYLPQDRYKVISNIWRYVSIEDDAAAYPVRYYYRPSSSEMLALLSRRQRGGPSRINRVIGFRTWRDAMLAGYRPDPISRPAPATDIVYLARLARTPALARYVEYIYAGQVAPESFVQSVKYTRSVVTVVQSRKDTRPLLHQTLTQVYNAFIGQGSLPSEVGVRQAAVVVKPSAGGTARPGMTGGMAMSAPETSASGNTREDDFNKFSNRAGKLANVPGNNR